MRIWVVMLAVVGCDSGAKDPVVSKPETRPPVVAAPADAAGDAISVIQPVPVDAGAAIVHALTTGWLDTPPWPANGKELEIAWLVGTDLVPRKSDPELLESPLSVVMTIGGVSRQAYLKQQFGSLKPYNQPACANKDDPASYPLPKGALAQITFFEGGAGGYYVKRKAPDVIEILTWEQEDGLCDVNGKPTMCPRREAAAVRMHVPAKLAVHEVIFNVDASGNRTPFDCKTP
jgi:hypothetical protein